ncbi:MAG: nitrous oxide reductase accessory protein NosL, partial [Longimicrobiales bacterium]|nr:nitrous oxide reductase accessory protein NosL [Longimicrobiales bacterium]
MLTRSSRILITIAALALGAIYVLPLWQISLEAPQYPEGIGMTIRVNTIEGQKPHDLNNINNLNHYIGMKRIEPDAIPELKIMPWIVALLILGGLATAITGRRRVLYGWVAFFLIVSLAGLADFWKWEYDYGHDLDEENAIIKIPGMNYQPPLIGSKQLLNFRAHSWPGWGGWIAIASCLTAVTVAGAEWRRGRRGGEGSADTVGGAEGRAGGADGTTHRASAGATAGVLLAVSAAGTLGACAAPAPREVATGVDACAHCLMTVADPAFAAEAVTPTGRVHIFDSIECLAGALEGELAGEAIHSLWVTDFADRETLVRAEAAHFLIGEGIASPMGAGVAAFALASERDRALAERGG